MSQNPLGAMMGAGYTTPGESQLGGPGGPNPVPPMEFPLAPETGYPPPGGDATMPGSGWNTWPQPGALPAPNMGGPMPDYWQGSAGGTAGPWRGAQMPSMPNMGSGGMPPPPMPGAPTMPNAPGAAPIGNGTQFGGVSTVDPQAQQADYGSVNQFADQAYDQSMRYLQPQMDQQNRRFDQELINRGIDPNSQAGTLAADQISRQQNDAMSKASFDALGFGQGVQNQMFQQDLARSGLAGQMQNNLWNAKNNQYGIGAGIYGDQLGFMGGQYGNQLGYLSNIFGTQAGMQNSTNSNQASMYNAQLGHSLGMGNLDVSRQRQDWGQLMDMETNRQWGANFNRQGDQWQQNLAMRLAGMDPLSMGPTGSPSVGNISQRPGEMWGDLGTNLWNWGSDQ